MTRKRSMERDKKTSRTSAEELMIGRVQQPAEFLPQAFLIVLIDDMSIRRIAVHADPRVLYS